ncbi:MAG: A24 family peptidase [Pararobbsia sp.]
MLTGLSSLFDGFSLLPAAIQYAFVVAFGLVIGSFITVVVHRLPTMLERGWEASVAEYLHTQPDTHSVAPPGSAAAHPAAQSAASGFGTEGIGELADTSAAPEVPAHPAPYNLMLPPSHCDACGHRLRAWENIPVISHVLLRGRCSQCGARISPRYLLIEIASGLLAALAWWHFGAGWPAVAAFAFTAVALTLTCIDWETRLLPDVITLPLLWAGLLINLTPTFATLGDAVVGAAVGYGALWCVYWGFWWWRGIEGIGHGDLKLFAALGAWVGWSGLIQVLVLSSAAGALVGLAMLATRRMKRDEPLPFGPFLAIAGCITLFAGTPFWPSLSLPGSGAFGG